MQVDPSDERGETPSPRILTDGSVLGDLSPGQRLQSLTTEHWSLLSTRSTPGVVSVVDGVLGGVLIGIVGVRLGIATSITLVAAIAVGLLLTALLAVYQYHDVVRRRALRRPRFQDEADRTDLPAQTDRRVRDER